MDEVLSYLHPVEPTVDLRALERRILSLWEQEGTFARSVEQRPADRAYVFYDGPPFATGLPHYGHILTSIVKDAIARFFTMSGYRVERRFGWDCHGVPVEFELEKELHLQGRGDIERLGIASFNEACRGIVLRYTREWESTIPRIGRWVDFRNDYKTMDPSYMETVWWVFKRLWEQRLIYQDYKVVHYSWRLSTPLSNFEATLDDAYREREDPALVARFRLDGQDACALAWTTTPWTLPANMALAVDPDMVYARVRCQRGDESVCCILARALVSRHLAPGSYQVEGELAGRELVGQTYQPLLPYFAGLRSQGAFRIVAADFVEEDEGTGIVHVAPAFGEDDFRLARAEGIPLVNPVDNDGCFTAQVPDWAGMNVFDANPAIIRRLEADGSLFSQGTIVHPYPHDWRTDTPLIYRAIPSWYVDVPRLKERMLANNEQINWCPSHIKHGGFGAWLANAREWAISRNRYWGTPVPVWQCPACRHQEVIGSIRELEERSGAAGIADIHRHKIDHLEIPCPACGGALRRVPEVLDCWFESGSMPYGQVHYPFEKREWFEANFPPDFIVEYSGQIRGWFYTLMVLSTALFDRPPFRNAVVHGNLLAEDGRKMSKRLRNYPEPTALVEEVGADALRLYLLGHPVIDGNDSRFEHRGVQEMRRRFILPVWNAFSFLTRYAALDGWRPPQHPSGPAGSLDRWIRSRACELSYQVGEALRSYDLRRPVGLLLEFVDDLTNWYIRRSRERFWRAAWDADKSAAYETLYEVLVLLSKVSAPLVPFLAEAIHRNLTGRDSVHLEDWPLPPRELIDQGLQASMAHVRQIASLGLAARARAEIKVRQPLAEALIRTDRPLGTESLALIADELNVKQARLLEDVTPYARPVARLDAGAIGTRFGAETPRLIQEARAGHFEELPGGRVRVGGNEAWVLGKEQVAIRYELEPGFACEAREGLVVVLDTRLSADLAREGLAREVVRQVQALRKEVGYALDDRIVVGVSTADPGLAEALSFCAGHVCSETLATHLLAAGEGDWDRRREVALGGAVAVIAVRRAARPG